MLADVAWRWKTAGGTFAAAFIVVIQLHQGELFAPLLRAMLHLL